MLQAWRQALELLRQRLDDLEFDALAGTLRPLRVHGRTLLVEAPDLRAVEKINQRFLRPIEEAFSQAFGTATRVVFQPPAAAQQELFPREAADAGRPDTSKARRSSGLVERLTFDSFVVGGGSQFAHAACRAVANLPGETYNPLFLYGGVGLGKTHLVNAIGNAIFERDPNARVLHLTSESFMNELITALRRDRMSEFRARFRRIEVLIVDDVQFLAGRERTQEEFFHTFNALYEGRHQIVLTSDKFPKDIPDLEERLRNRFEWGLIADIQAPDVETRVAILQRKAEDEQIDLPDDVAMFLAERFETNVRELEGALTRLAAHASIYNRVLDLALAHEVLHESALRERTPITIEAVQKAVCEYFHVRSADLRSKKRTRTIAVPRQVAMYLCRRLTNASFPSIGDRFGGRDHSTVIHAAQVVNERIKQDPVLRSAVERISRMLENGGDPYGKPGERL